MIYLFSPRKDRTGHLQIHNCQTLPLLPDRRTSWNDIIGWLIVGTHPCANAREMKRNETNERSIPAPGAIDSSSWQEASLWDFMFKTAVNVAQGQRRETCANRNVHVWRCFADKCFKNVRKTIGQTRNFKMKEKKRKNARGVFSYLRSRSCKRANTECNNNSVPRRYSLTRENRRTFFQSDHFQLLVMLTNIK